MIHLFVLEILASLILVDDPLELFAEEHFFLWGDMEVLSLF